MADEPNSNGDKPHLHLVPKDDPPPNINGSGSDFWEQIDAERDRRDLEVAYDRWRDGDITAFNTAMWLVWRRSPEAIPRELLRMGEAVVAAAMSEEEKRARREYVAHKERWEMVVELRERHAELTQRGRIELERAEAALVMANKMQNVEERARLLRLLPMLKENATIDYGSTLEQARVMVAETLTRTGLKKVEPSTVRQSFDIIEGAGGPAATFETFLIERKRRDELRRRRGQPPLSEPEE